MGAGKRRGDRNRRDVQDIIARSGLRERPPREFPPGTRANPIVAASERELRDVRRLTRNIGIWRALALSYRLLPNERFSRFIIPAAGK